MPLDQLALTLSFSVKNGLDLLLLSGNSKRPAGNAWQATQDPEVVTAHVDGGGGVALIVGPSSGVLAFDGDSLSGVKDLGHKLGSMPLHTTGNPLRFGHTFFKWEPGLQNKVFDLAGEPIADIKGASGRGYLIAPSGIPYESGDKKLWFRTWAVDPRALELEPMPALWRDWVGSRQDTKRGDGQSPVITQSAPTQTFKVGTKTYVLLHNELCKAWRCGLRHDIAGATTSILYGLGVEPSQIAELVFEVATNKRDGERRMRLAAVKSTVSRIEAGLPCRGASTFRSNGLGDTLDTIRNAVNADLVDQVGPLMACAYGAGRGDRQ